MSGLPVAGTVLLRLLLLTLLAGVPGATRAAESAAVTTPRVTATLIANRNAVTPGERFQVALVQNISKGWHTYWANPGDSGEPTRIEWVLPDGATASDIKWPAPKAIPVEPLVNHGFEGIVYLLVDVTAPKDAKTGDHLALKANATWLVCEKICIPEDGSFTLDLPVQAASVTDANADQRIASAQAALPEPASFTGKLTADGDNLTLALPGLSPSVTDLHFFPLSDTLIDHAAPQVKQAVPNGIALQLARSSAFKIAEHDLAGVLTYRENGGARALSVKADADPALVTDGATNPASLANAGLAPPENNLTLWTALLFAFAGGLILNLMPCVLPVLFVKAFGFAQAAMVSPRQVREQGLLFLLGVLATFAVLAGLIIGVGALGSTAGWGYQLQSPPVVIALAVVMTLIGLNLLGAFEIGGAVQGIGNTLSSTKGRTGAFLTGVLAVVVATPCTAPFMGAAMGFALTQPPAIAFSVFIALAVGFAFPVVALAFAPGWIRLLPRPGRWMVILKQAFAFPMFATAIWLVWVVSVQAGADGVLAALGAILTAGFIVWLLNTTRQSTARTRLLGGGGAAAAAVAAIALVASLAIPSPAAKTADIQAWTPERVAALQAQGKPVFVNFTAAWCITCLANERVALSQPDVKAAFAALDIAYLKADWTNRDALIAQTLAQHGRAGVPLYLFYSASRGAPAEVLPQLLTPKTVITAAERAAGRAVTAEAKQ